MAEPSQTTTRPLIRIYGRLGSASAHAIRDFLHRSDVPFEWIHFDTDEQARAQAGVEHRHDSRLPVCVFPDGTRMECPTIRQITEQLGWFCTPSRSEYDLAIYGAGPAGLSAAVYGASDGLKVVVVERWALGGQAGSSPKIENYLGFPAGISGAELFERAQEQACRFGAEKLAHAQGSDCDWSSAMRAVSAWGAATMLVTALAVPAVVDEIPEAALSAGSFSVALADRTAFSEPAPVLDYRQREKFLRGRQHFNQKWVVFPSLGGDWGLGPTFIADRCSGCHVGGGRGDTPKSADQQLLSVLVRISIPGEDEHGGPKPHPNYGDQIQNQGLMGQDRDATYLGERVPQEAELYLDWQEVSAAFADGEKVTLRKPRLRVERLNFGPLGPEVMYSLRIAQPTFGLGLLEAVSEPDILQIAEEQRSQGVNGRPNYVWDAIGKRVALGRFGWKSNQASIRQQIAAAAHGDLGVTSPLFDKENCPPVQQDCAYQPPGNQPELIEVNWDELEFWTRALAVPTRRNVDDPDFRSGARLFAEAKCAVCHVAEMKAGVLPGLPQIRGQVFHAYTDLLLHDMGEELADGRPDSKAGPRDWRTAPLWGLGLSQTVNGSTAMLHDGRARNATEAILWHGGEAESAREAFQNMPKADREVLLKFLSSI